MNLHSPDWTRRYEQVRAHGVGSVPEVQESTWGWAVLVQRGMRCWMEAWQSPVPPSGGSGPSSSSRPPLQNPSTATVLLTNMMVRALGLEL
jgi:hypothetical protein